MNFPNAQARALLYWIVALLTLVFAGLAHSTERTFLELKQSCYFAGGQVFVTSQTEPYYNEIIGTTESVMFTMCGKSFFDTRACSPFTLYGFQMVCRNGIATVPQLFMSMFGQDKTTQENRLALNGNNQLTYVDPLKDFSGSTGRRIGLPLGYAPLVPIETLIRKLDWDDALQHPRLAESLSADKERRIRDLFPMQGGLVQPFPASNIRRAANIAVERQSATAAPAQAPSTSASAPPSDLRIDSTLSIKVIIAALVGLFFAYLKSVSSAHWVIKWALGIAESAIAVYLGTKETLGIGELVIFLAPFGVELVLELGLRLRREA